MANEADNTAVVIIDMQVGFRNQWTENLEKKITAFLNTIKDCSIFILGTRYVNNVNTACYVFEGWTDCMEGTPDAEILPALQPFLQRVFDKDKFSCWNEEMKQFVKKNAIGKIYFAGVNTGCCVLHSVFDCYNDLVDCSVIADLCGSTSGPKEHEAALVVLKSCIMEERVISAEQASIAIRGLQKREDPASGQKY